MRADYCGRRLLGNPLLGLTCILLCGDEVIGCDDQVSVGVASFQFLVERGAMLLAARLAALVMLVAPFDTLRAEPVDHCLMMQLLVAVCRQLSLTEGQSFVGRWRFQFD